MIWQLKNEFFTYFFEKDFHDFFVTFVYSSQQWSDSKLVWSLINGGRERGRESNQFHMNTFTNSQNVKTFETKNGQRSASVQKSQTK